MYIKDELKINKFQLVRIPSNKEYFGRVGLSSIGTGDQYTGDEMMPQQVSKIDNLAYMDAYDKMMASEESK